MNCVMGAGREVLKLRFGSLLKSFITVYTVFANAAANAVSLTVVPLSNFQVNVGLGLMATGCTPGWAISFARLPVIGVPVVVA